MARYIARVTLVIGILLNVAATINAQQSAPTPADPFAGAQEKEAVLVPRPPMARAAAYLRGGKLIGERIFYDNGKVAQEIPLRPGKKVTDPNEQDGMVRQFYQSGALFCELPYSEGKLNGTVRFYKETGEPLGSSTLKEGTGVLRQYPLKSLWLDDEDIPFKNGKIDGTKRQWGHFEGLKGYGCDMVQYVNGFADGWEATVDADGSVLSTDFVHFDWLSAQSWLHGLQRKFAPGGTLEKGFPKYFVRGDVVSQSAYLKAAKKDDVLRKSLNDDGRDWAKKAFAVPRGG